MKEVNIEELHKNIEDLVAQDAAEDIKQREEIELKKAEHKARVKQFALASMKEYAAVYKALA